MGRVKSCAGVSRPVPGDYRASAVAAVAADEVKTPRGWRSWGAHVLGLLDNGDEMLTGHATRDRPVGARKNGPNFSVYNVFRETVRKKKCTFFRFFGYFGYYQTQSTLRVNVLRFAFYETAENGCANVFASFFQHSLYRSVPPPSTCFVPENLAGKWRFFFSCATSLRRPRGKIDVPPENVGVQILKKSVRADTTYGTTIDPEDSSKKPRNIQRALGWL